MRRILFVLLLAITQISATPAPPSVPIRTEEAPLVAVIANPERYNGKVVTVEGFLRLEYEGDAIYLDRSHFDAGLFSNAVWVDGPKFDEPAARDALSDRYVRLTGRFNAGGRGHLGMFSGTFEEVSLIQPLLSRKQLWASMMHWRGNLPWPLLISVLLVATGAMAMMVKLKNIRSPSASDGPIVWGTLLIAGAAGIFSIGRLWEHPMIIHSMLRSGLSSMTWPLLLEFVVGMTALTASMIFAFRRKLLPTLLFAAGQLAVPAAIEFHAFRVLDAPLSIHSAQADDYRWERLDSRVPDRPIR